MMSWSARSSQCATTALPSIGTIAWRDSSTSRLTTTLAFFDSGVEAVVHRQREEQVVVPLFVHAHGLVEARRVRIDQRGQFLDVELDSFAQVFGLGARLRHAHHHRLADKAHLAVRERRLRGNLVAGQRRDRDDVFRPDQVLAHEYPALRSGGLPDAADAAVRDRAPEERDFALARQHHVRNVLAAPVQMARILLAQHARAYALSGLAMLSHPILREVQGNPRVPPYPFPMISYFFAAETSYR